MSTQPDGGGTGVGTGVGIGVGLGVGTGLGSGVGKTPSQLDCAFSGPFTFSPNCPSKFPAGPYWQTKLLP